MRLARAVARLVKIQRQWHQAFSEFGAGVTEPPVRPRQVAQFGSNPGNLQMFTYCPKRLRPSAPLVVVLHGCQQNAVEYAFCSGWTALADEQEFALLLPEQRRTNNRNACFNWFQLSNVTRDRGEALSIRQMIGWCLAKLRVDERQIFLTGFSAGAAMGSALLAAYPEVFSGGALIAGLPVGSAVNFGQAFSAMSRPQPHSNVHWGDQVRAASSHRGRWPTISIWYGSADTTVSPANAEASVNQWCNVHGLGDERCQESAAGDLVRRRTWQDKWGRIAVESVEVVGFGHGTPIDAFGRNGAVCGRPGPFVIDAGVSSTREIAKFFSASRDSEIFSLQGLKRRLLG